MFQRLVRVAEPYLKAWFIAPWKGHHVVYSDLSQAAIPWGFVPQKKILEKVGPSRERSSFIDKRAERLNLDTQELLKGTEHAYRCITKLFTTRHIAAATATGIDRGAVEKAPEAEHDAGGTDGDDTGVIEGNASEAGGGTNSGGSGAMWKSDEDDAATEDGSDLFPYTDFLGLDVASPQLSMFFNDVLDSYWRRNLVPRLSVKSVSARLCSLGVRLGGISKNTNFLGLMSADEAKYHLTMGMLGPEGTVINELEGRAPQKIIADVCLTCEEEFSLEDENGKVVHTTASQEPKVHYMTLQSNIDPQGELEWQVTNINDVILPTYDYYFSKFGH